MAPDVGLTVLRGARGGLARVRYARGASVPSHTHRQEELLLVERGRLLVEVGESEYILGPGEYLVLPAGQAHSVRALGQRRAAAVVAYLGGPVARKTPDVL